MDETTSKGLSLPVVILITVLVIGFSIMIWNKTRPMQKQSSNNLNTINQALTANQYDNYDGTNVSGADVISAINTKATPSLVVHVTTNSGSEDYTAGYNVTNVSDPNYIEGSANFNATLNKNTNGSVVGISFAEQ